MDQKKHPKSDSTGRKKASNKAVKKKEEIARFATQ